MNQKELLVLPELSLILIIIVLILILIKLLSKNPNMCDAMRIPARMSPLLRVLPASLPSKFVSVQRKPVNARRKQRI